MTRLSKDAKVVLMLVLLAGIVSCQAAASGGGSATMNWRRFEGTQISGIFVPHSYTSSLQAMLPEFEALTGMKVEMVTLPWGETNTKLLADLAGRHGQFDVVFSNYWWDWAYADFLEPLDPYLDNPELTDKAWYDVKDFWPQILNSARWSRVPGEPTGKGPLFTIPTMIETHILAYRQDLFDRYGCSVPKTWEELCNTALKLTGKKDPLAPELYGLVSRGDKIGGPVLTSVIAGYKSYGATDFDSKMRCAINSPDGVKFTSMYLDAVKKGGPPGWTTVDWDTATHRFPTGGYAMIFDTDFTASTYESPDSSIIGKYVRYAEPPGGPEGRFSNIWYWGLAINESSKKKEAAWLFIQWATSKDVLHRAAVKYNNFNPSRASVWNQSDVKAIASKWGQGTWLSAVEANLARNARLLLTPTKNVLEVLAAWMEELHGAYAGRVTAAEALNAAAKRINEIVKQK